MKLGEIFVKKGLASNDEIELALETQKKIGGKLGDILFSIKNLRSLDYYQAIASHFQLKFVDLIHTEIDQNLLLSKQRNMYFSQLVLPIKQTGHQIVVATANPSDETFELIHAEWGGNAEIVCTSKFDILWTLQKVFDETYIEESISELNTSNQSLSAKKTFCTWHKIFLAIFFIFLVSCLSINPLRTLLVFNLVLSFILFGILIYKFLLTLIGMFLSRKIDITQVEANLKNLPIYTVLIPLYQEKEVILKALINNLNNLDYPKHKLDIKILLESDDTETIEILKNLHISGCYEFIYIPNKLPRTKAKACNYGLKFARGEYLTIYDAEDKPDPLQLKKALAVFHGENEQKLACVQCCLNFYNSNDNWLTKMFTLEYSYWFDYMLPALEYVGAPIPLGGTSNHFKTECLKKIRAWDPYNVSEDADIGIRLNRLGYKEKVMPSTTYEEANTKLYNWIKQRSRWIKGYMQTYLVHMRNPFKLWRAIGTKGFIGFQLFVGGTFVSNLANVLLWIFFISYFFLNKEYVEQIFPPIVLKIALFNFIGGLFIMILLNLIAALRRKKYYLIFHALTAPIYWLFMSIASYRALYQLFFKPNYWDKTEHGISKALQ